MAHEHSDGLGDYDVPSRTATAGESDAVTLRRIIVYGDTNSALTPDGSVVSLRTVMTSVGRRSSRLAGSAATGWRRHEEAVARRSSDRARRGTALLALRRDCRPTRRAARSRRRAAGRSPCLGRPLVVPHPGRCSGPVPGKARLRGTTDTRRFDRTGRSLESHMLYISSGGTHKGGRGHHPRSHPCQYRIPPSPV